jgi:hypothetical protein
MVVGVATQSTMDHSKMGKGSGSGSGAMAMAALKSLGIKTLILSVDNARANLGFRHRSHLQARPPDQKARCQHDPSAGAVGADAPGDSPDTFIFRQ